MFTQYKNIESGLGPVLQIWTVTVQKPALGMADSQYSLPWETEGSGEGKHREALARKREDSLKCHLLENIWGTLLQSLLALFFFERATLCTLGQPQTHVLLASSRIIGTYYYIWLKKHFLKTKLSLLEGKLDRNCVKKNNLI